MLAAMLPGVSVFLDVRQRPIRPYRPLLCDRLLSLRPHTSSSHGTYSGVCYARCVIACGSRLAVIEAFLCFQPQQVDNLRSIDALEEEISATGVVMIYASKGYFKSKSKRGATATPVHTSQAHNPHSLTLGPNAYTCLHRLPPRGKRDIGARKALLCHH